MSSNFRFLTTYRAKGIIDENHALSLGAAGLSPVVDEVQQSLLKEADTILLIGFDMVEMRPNWLEGWLEHADVVSMSTTGQIDIPTTLTVDWRGNIAEGLNALKDQVRSPKWNGQPDTIRLHQARWQTIFESETDLSALNPARAIEQIQKYSPDDTVLCLDVGAHRITASHVWICRQPRSILQSNGFSSMGVGLPMAISVKLHEPKTPVIALTGDMGLWMSLGELGVIQERGLHVVVDLSLRFSAQSH